MRLRHRGSASTSSPRRIDRRTCEHDFLALAGRPQLERLAMTQNAEAIQPSYPLFRDSEYRESLSRKKALYEEAHDAGKIREVFDWTTTEEYKNLNFQREALTVNPAKACQPLGAVLCALGFEKTMPYVHGSQGCVAY